MNLIQIKQIDGLRSSLDSLSDSIYTLDQDVTGAFSNFDDYWGQFEWDEDHVVLKSGGGTVDGHEYVALGITNGHLYVNNSGVFGGLSSEGDSYFTSAIGQIHYKNIQGEDVQLKGATAPNYEKMFATPTKTLVEDDHIVGVDTSTLLVDSTVTLPSAADVYAGKEYSIKDEGGLASVYNITLTGVYAETIDGNLGVNITGNYGNVSVYSDGANWHCLDVRDTDIF